MVNSAQTVQVKGERGEERGERGERRGERGKMWELGCKRNSNTPDSGDIPISAVAAAGFEVSSTISTSCLSHNCL